ncbi:MAG: calcium-binding protein [Planktotalea sp.]|uniref:calcium-binding protein n=1 Tax=Planktotalea sp. TaxID=2029877 RepID=UPI003C70B50F
MLLLGDDITVTVTQTGTVIGTHVNGSTGAVDFEGENAYFTNHGTVTGTDMYGVFFGEATSTLNNTGQISGVTGALLWDASSSIVNSGTIMGNEAGTTVDYDENGISVRGDASVVTNLAGGIIGTTAQDGSGVVYISNFSGSLATLNNFGQITGGAYGVVNFDTGGSTVINIQNHGTIHGGVAGIQGGVGMEHVSNSGLIVGDVNLGTGADSYTGVYSGSVIGNVNGEAGMDVLKGGELNDSFFGGDDNDTLFGRGGDDMLFGDDGEDDIRGGSGDDAIFGGSQDDTIYGHSGNDELEGDGGADLIVGGAGDDTITGGGAGDELRGGAGNDDLSGNSGADVIYGGAGDDTITGGSAADEMRGNSGADAFVFTAQSDSSTSDFDTILDFQSGLVVLDFSAIDSFTFIGTDSFSGTGAEVRYQLTGSGARLKVDVDGDGSTDMRIELNNVDVLTGADFIL